MINQTENCNLGALAGPDEFPQTPQSRARSGAVPERSRNLSTENQGTNEDGSQNDPRHGMGVCMSSSSQGLDPDETYYMVTDVQEGLLHPFYMVTSDQGKNLYRSPGTSSGKQKKARSSTELQIRKKYPCIN